MRFRLLILSLLLCFFYSFTMAQVIENIETPSMDATVWQKPHRDNSSRSKLNCSKIALNGVVTEESQDTYCNKLIDQSVICTSIFDPVCGDDGKTYSNDCIAVTNYGVKKWKKGFCGATSGNWIYAPCDDGDPNTINDRVKEDCSCKGTPISEYCDDLKVENPICPLVIDPVCGDDGLTYDNSCLASSNGVKKWKNGRCGSTIGDWIYAPCLDGQGNEGTIDDNCNCIVDDEGSEKYCNDLINQSVVCSSVYDPVCGDDGKTYENDCIAKNKYGVKKWKRGTCDATTGDWIIAICIDDNNNVGFVDENCNCNVVSDNKCTDNKHPDYDALMLIYDYSGGVNWTNNSGWKDGKDGNSCDPCRDSWKGIECENNRVTRINLYNNNLKGTLPSLDQLERLKYFSCSKNLLGGSLPSLSRLTQLEVFSASRNEFTGKIPELSALTSLKKFYCWENNLSGSIPSLTGLSNLEEFSCRNNKLSGSLPDLSNLSELTIFRCSNNRISGSLPDFIPLINHGLQFFDGRNNDFSGCIPSLEALCQKNILFEPLPQGVTLFFPPDLDLFLSGNKKLPWEGKLGVKDGSGVALGCRFSETTVGAPCDDGNPNTTNDKIQEDCGCGNGPIESNCTDNKHPDYDALMAIYDSTNGDNWTSNRGWKDGKAGKSCDPCRDNWFGIECENNRVTRIELFNNGLQGTLPPLGHLNELKYFSCSKNSLSGYLPLLNGLQKLEVFYASRNKFTGVISDLSGLTQLKEFSCWENQLSGSIPSLEELTNLKIFYCNNNQLTGSIPSLKELTKLEDFYCWGNRLTGSIPSLEGLINLESFSCSKNQLTGRIPPELRTLKSLKDFYCNNNKITGSIPSLREMTNLEEFYCWGNQLTGSIPSLEGLINLKYFSCSKNQLTGVIPSELSTLKNVKAFTCNKNQLTGNIPSLKELINLEEFYCWGNNLTGSIPALDNLTQLREFSCYQNDLTGSLPTGMGSLKNIKIFYAHDNNLSGCVPIDFSKYVGALGQFNDSANNEEPGYYFMNNPKLPHQGDLAKITDFNNQIGLPCDDGNPNTTNDKIQEDCGCGNGPIESNCTDNKHPDYDALMAIYDSTNGDNWTSNRGWKDGKEGKSCDPCRDGWIGIRCKEGRVTELFLNGQKLSGQIPKEVQNLAFLRNLQLAENPNLSGVIPPLEKLVNLETLYLFENNLSGEIPDLSNLVKLSSINLRSNSLSGRIPDLKDLYNIAWLYLNENKLSGNIQDLSTLYKLEIFDVSNNRLTGNIPPLDNHFQLYKFNVSDNMLSGNLPNLDKLYELGWFNISGNELTGNIPDLSNLTNLYAFNVSHNKLTGPLPMGLDKLESIKYFICHDNNLSGCIPLEFNTYIGSLGSKGNLEDFVSGYNLRQNPLLPHQGDISKLQDLNTQIGVPCDDGDSSTKEDKILDDCSCGATPTAVHFSDLSTYLEIFPNLASSFDDVVIRYRDNTEVSHSFEMEVYNCFGKTISKNTIKRRKGDWSITLDNIAQKGLYFVRLIRDNQEKVVLKFIVN